MNQFVIKSPYKPTGDQPQAIAHLAEGIERGLDHQVLLGVTGSGKTFTMANIIQSVQRPTLVIAHNKTLAAQLCSELREIFPDSAVEYFVSYYDYYQPEAYIAQTDTYIEKDASINEEIARLRHSATSALRERRDVIVVSSVSCIYSIGDPKEYEGMSVSLREGMNLDRDDVIRMLVNIQFERNDIAFERGTFRVRGDVLEILPAMSDMMGIRVEFFGDTIERISEIEVTTGRVTVRLSHYIIFPASHYVVSQEAVDNAIGDIERDLEIRLEEFRAQDKLLEAQRLEQRTHYDIEMMREVGYCTGIENYSRYFDGRKPGDSPYSLLDYFPEDFICFIDESHVSVPQIRAMYAGDFARKDNLVEYGFRLPSAYDNRPLKFDEFAARIPQVIYVSATPAEYELTRSKNTVEQIIRPTGLIDPLIVLRPASGQVDDLYGELVKVAEAGNRALVTTLTKKMAENLTSYLREMGLRVEYLHSDVQTLDRIKILRDLRMGEFDILVGINLLREGLDLPEVTLVAILDADKEGFLRSETSLIQTIGRAARNVDGRVIMYADSITGSMRRSIDETNRRRAIQMQYNQEHNITPETVRKAIAELLIVSRAPEEETEKLSDEERALSIAHIEDQMLEAAAHLDFEKAAKLRDQLFKLKGEKVADVGAGQPKQGRYRKGGRNRR